jgi:putative membrane protein
MWGWGPGGWAGWLVMGLSMLVFWGGLIVLAAWAIRSFSPNRDPRAGAPSSAVAILEECFARGEIDREEYEGRKAALEGR